MTLASISKEELTNILAEKLGLAAADIYVSAPKEAWSLRNQLWQGRPARRRFPLGLAFIEDSRKVETAVSNAVERLSPVDNGFESVVFCQRNDAGKWSLIKIVERIGGTLAWKLKQLCPAIEVMHVKPQNTAIPVVELGQSTANLVKNAQRLLLQRPNLVLQGPPGTGKTFVALQVAEALAEERIEPLQLSVGLKSTKGDLPSLISQKWFVDLPLVWEIIQMHPGYTYDDFVRGRTIVAGPGGSQFQSVDRVIPQLAAVAKARAGKPTLLIIDEINRCNLATVLGELIFAIDPDKRGEPIRLQYPPPPGDPLGTGELLAIPEGLLLLATMNTADRSIALVDFAIRRRFRFVDVLPSSAVVAEFYASDPAKATKVVSVFQELSKLVRDPRLRLGHSYFLCPLEADWSTRVANRLTYEVIPLLREYRAEGHLVGNAAWTLPGQPTADLIGVSGSLSEQVRDQIRGYLDQ